jgi:L-asparaginase
MILVFLKPIPLIGVSLYGENRYFRGPYRTHTADGEFSLEGVTALPRVDVIYVTAGVSPDLVDAAVAAGTRGLVIAGVGNGNMNAGALAAVGRAVSKGVIVVRASRVMGGAVGRNVEVDDDELGTVVAGELNPAKARVLLKLALMETRDAGRVQSLFDRY